MLRNIMASLLFFASFLFAQQSGQMRLTTIPTILEGEIIDKNVRDINGETCAGLVIYHNLEGLTYDSELQIVKVNNKPGRDFLFLSPGERQITVYCTSFTPLKINLKELGISLKSGEVWQVKITGDKKRESISIVINAKPADAKITLDNITYSSGAAIPTTEGAHEIKLELEGYRTIEDSIKVNTNNILFSYELEQIELILVKFSSIPSGAKLLIDKIEKGETDKDLFLYPGKYQIKISKAGYIDSEKEIEVVEKGPNIFSFRLVKNSAALSIKTTPADAKILLNKEDYTGKNEIELSPGKYRLQIIKEGYKTIDETINIELEKPLNKNYSLIRKTGKFQFTVQPTDAVVELQNIENTVETWTGSKYIKDIGTGIYTLKVTKPDYETFSKQITIEENQSSTEDIVLKKIISGNENERTSQNASQQDLSSSTVSCPPQITYEGKIYHTAVVGRQCWLKENLDLGIMIKNNRKQLGTTTIEKYCYENKAENCALYGGLYQWQQAMKYSTIEKAQGICPAGWHIPSKSEFYDLSLYVKESTNALKAIGQGNDRGAGTNTSGFSVLLGGYMEANNHYSNYSFFSYFWTSTQEDKNNATTISIYSDDTLISFAKDSKNVAESIRCIKDEDKMPDPY